MPAARETMFAAVAEGEEKRGHATLHRSDDAGWSWREVDPGLGTLPWRAQLAQSGSNPEILYFSAGESEAAIIARSEDGGESWTRMPAVGLRCGQCWYNQSLAVHPTDPDVVYFGGVLLYRSDSGGATFSMLGRADIHVDQHVLTVDARAPDMLLVGNDGGVYRSLDRGETWESLNTNLSLTQFYAGVSIHPRAEAISVLGGTQDNGTIEGDGDLSWPQVMGGDGGFTALDPRFDRRWAETQWRGGTGGPRRSDNGGSFRYRGRGIDLGDDALFIPPLVMDPFDPDVLYFGTELLYRTVDGGELWEPIAEAAGGEYLGHRPQPLRRARGVCRDVRIGHRGDPGRGRNVAPGLAVSAHALRERHRGAPARSRHRLRGVLGLRHGPCLRHPRLRRVLERHHR